MSATKYTCDQAIFTSIHTPMGEGYRIVAASRGLRADEKQTITRYSPSHEGLCVRCADDPGSAGVIQAASFYPLPRGRLCVALSCPAGAEHTGRGGQRVYTHNAIIAADDWPMWGYSPFNVLRAMAAAGLTTPELSPPAVLPELELSVDAAVSGVRCAKFHPVVSASCRLYLLQELLQKHRLIVNIDGGWLETAEALLLGIPGPLRCKVSFGAGLRFAVSHSHDLDLLNDDDGKAKVRAAGQSVEYIDPRDIVQADATSCAWLTFVDRHWTKGDLPALARRTSRAFDDAGPAGRNYVARLCNCMDGVGQRETGKLLSMASVYLSQGLRAPERDLVAELLDLTRHTLEDRFGRGTWGEVRCDWPTLAALSGTSAEAGVFTDPIIEKALRSVMTADPLQAAEAALDLVSAKRLGESRPNLSAVIEEVLRHLADWADKAPPRELDKLSGLCTRWNAVHPGSPSVERLRARCEAPASVHAAAPDTPS